MCCPNMSSKHIIKFNRCSVSKLLVRLSTSCYKNYTIMAAIIQYFQHSFLGTFPKPPHQKTVLAKKNIDPIMNVIIVWEKTSIA